LNIISIPKLVICTQQINRDSYTNDYLSYLSLTRWWNLALYHLHFFVCVSLVVSRDTYWNKGCHAQSCIYICHGIFVSNHVQSLSQLEKRPFKQSTRLMEKRLAAFSISLEFVWYLLILYGWMYLHHQIFIESAIFVNVLNMT
jgi:hypothetical protein